MCEVWVLIRENRRRKGILAGRVGKGRKQCRKFAVFLKFNLGMGRVFCLFVCLSFFFFGAGIELRASHMLGKCRTTELHPSPST
jgi:hypothetical protein